MKNKLNYFGGLILFYTVIIFGVLLLNFRFSYLNSLNNNEPILKDNVAMKN